MDCEFCSLSFKTKYTLKWHQSNNKACLKSRGLSLETRFVCAGCSLTFTNNINLATHMDICKKFMVLNVQEECKKQIEAIQQECKENTDTIQQECKETIKAIQQECKKQIESVQEKFESIQVECKEQIENTRRECDETIKEHKNTIKQHERVIMDTKFTTDKIIRDLQAQNDKLIDSLRQLASQAIEKPSTTNVTNHNTIRNHFSEKYFLDAITPEDVKKKCQNYLTEEVFFQGQRGIAQLCTDHIIRTKDQKALMICTDASRKKFKYMDEQGNLKEDHEARAFTEKVSKPIKDVSKILYENILSDVKYEKENVDDEDYSRKSVLSNKEMKAIDCFVQITYFDHPDHNMEYKNELAIRSAFGKSAQKA
jgi:hypothetical protein